MSNLPHPLGDSSAGDMFYPGSPSVIATDTPGAAGSRAVEFGEDGLSSAVNRMGYALAKNDEYMQARMEAKIAKPEFATFVPSGGNGDTYTFSGVDLFVGAADYLPETQAVRDSLISVLDTSYNELLDASGDRVVVKEIRNVGDLSSIVGDTAGAGGDDDGFYDSGALIRFGTVDPVTGAANPGYYTLPDAVGVVFVHGLARTIDSLATGGSEHLLRDGWFKGATRGISEIHAGTFLKDGSRLATGNFDMNSKKLLNVDEARGASGADMLLHSQQDLNLQDQYLTVPLSEAGDTSVVGGKSSVVGAVNNNTYLTNALSGNRCVAGGALTFDPGGASITVPAGTVVSLNGTATPKSGVHTVVGLGSNLVLVVDASGAFQERVVGGVLSTDAPIAIFNSTGAAFDLEIDARWLASRNSSTDEITVGDRQGCDFVDLQGALDLAYAASLITATGTVMSGIPTIRVRGTVPVASTLSVRCDVRIIGDPGALLESDAAFDVDTNFIECPTTAHKIIMENLLIKWSGSSAQNAANSMIVNCATGSVFLDLDIYGVNSTNGFGRGFFWSLAGQEHIALRRCRFRHLQNSVLNTNSNVDYMSMHNIRISDCDGSSDIGLALLGEGHTLDRIRFEDDSYGSAVKIGPGSEIRESHLQGVGPVVEFDDSSSTRKDFLIDGCTISATTQYGVYTALAASYEIRCTIRNSDISGSRALQIDNASSPDRSTRYHVENCKLYGDSTYIAYFSNARDVLLTSTYIKDDTGLSSVYATGDTSLRVKSSTFEGNAATEHIEMDSPTDALLEGNHFLSGKYQISGTASHIRIIGNYHYYGEEAAIYLSGASDGIKIIGNHFVGNNYYSIRIDHTSALRPIISENEFYQCEAQPVSGDNGFVVRIHGATDSHAKIINNSFYECGDSSATDNRVTYIVETGGRSEVRGNTFVQALGQNTPSISDEVRFVVVGNYSTVADNEFHHDFTVADSAQPENMIGIIPGTYNRVSGNRFYWLGTHPETASQMVVVRGVDLANDHCTLESNFMGAHTMSPVTYLIYAGTNNSIVARNQSIDGSILSTGNYNMFLSNVVENDDLNAGGDTDDNNVLIGNISVGNGDIMCEGDNCVFVGNAAYGNGDISAGVTQETDGNENVVIGQLMGGTGTLYARGQDVITLGNQNTGAATLSFNVSAASAAKPHNDTITNLGAQNLRDQMNG